MADSSQFHSVLQDSSASLVADDRIKRVVFCSGKVHDELSAAREARGINDIALVRVEQSGLFPFDSVAEQAARYSNAEIVWAQEEPHNIGFWTYISRRIENALVKINREDSRHPRYVGHPPATTAPEPQIEQAQIIQQALA